MLPAENRIVEEPVRLACPQCELVYRLKKYTPGKAYACKNCGAPLVTPDAVPADGGASAAPPRPPASAYDNSADVARGRAAIAAGRAPESDLSRLPKMIELLSRRLDAVKGLDLAGGDDDAPASRLLRLNERLESDFREFSGAVSRRLDELDGKVSADVAGEMHKALRELDDKLSASLADSAGDMKDDLARRLTDLEQKLGVLAENALASSGGLDDLTKALRQQQDAFALRLEDEKREFAAHREKLRRDLEAQRDAQREALVAHRDEQKKALVAFLTPPENPPNTTVEVDIDELADRLVAGVRGHAKLLDRDSDAAMDAMARLADELVKEQSANTARLDKLAEEIKSATAGIAKMEEWRGELPERVADEIGQTVEARVVGPISDTLTKHAPAILSEFHDNKLVDLVSRSVREAQRPLLREILAGGRRGVPLWLFASVLLPLLLILGYLFLPGDFGGRETAAAVPEEMGETLARIETGMNMVADNEDRLRTIEDAVLDIHSEALAHVKNAATLEEEVRNLRAALAERDKLMNDYKETLQTQVKRLREYEMRLSQLGVSPKAIGE